MGMYTELYIACRIRGDVPIEVINILNHMFSVDAEPEKLPEHDFFKCHRWGCLGTGSSYYFVPESVSCFRRDSINSGYTLISRSDLKNYDDEIAKFIDWIKPYIEGEPYDHIGHYRYEENDKPTLLFLGDINND